MGLMQEAPLAVPITSAAIAVFGGIVGIALKRPWWEGALVGGSIMVWLPPLVWLCRKVFRGLVMRLLCSGLEWWWRLWGCEE